MEESHQHMWRRWRRRAVRTLALTLPEGARLLSAPRPLPQLHTPFAKGTARELLVFLPGMDELPGDFRQRGFVEAAWRAGLRADVIETDLHLGYFLRGTALESLHQDVVLTARARGYERIWLVGLSLGGFGALRYAQTLGESVDGVILLAPTVGRGPLAALLAQKPGERQPGAAGGDVEWLPRPRPTPPVYLAFGHGDPFAPAHRLLTEFLPKGHTFSAPGGHDWNTWAALWTTLLSRVFTQPRHV